MGRWLTPKQAFRLLTKSSDEYGKLLTENQKEDEAYFELFQTDPRDIHGSIWYADGSVDGFWLNFTQGVETYICGVYVHRGVTVHGTEGEEA